jgi:hypothetical protein
MESGSTDMGDLCSLMPAIHPSTCGAVGKCHGNNYYIVDHEAATIDSAKLQLGMLYLLLKDGADRAKRIKEEYKPLFATKAEYLNYIDTINKSGDRIIYNEDDTATIIL